MNDANCRPTTVCHPCIPATPFTTCFSPPSAVAPQVAVDCYQINKRGMIRLQEIVCHMHLVTSSDWCNFLCGNLGWGLWPPNLNCGWDFCTVHLAAKFRHPMFNRLEVIVLTNKQTNKQTPLKTSTSLCYAMPVGNYHKQAFKAVIECNK